MNANPSYLQKYFQFIKLLVFIVIVLQTARVFLIRSPPKVSHAALSHLTQIKREMCPNFEMHKQTDEVSFFLVLGYRLSAASTHVENC